MVFKTNWINVDPNNATDPNRTAANSWDQAAWLNEAGGALNTPPPVADGSVTTVKLADLAVTAAKVAAANKDGAVGTASMRTLGAGAAQAAAGNHGHAAAAPAAHEHAGPDVTTGTVARARLGTGTPAAGQYVDGGTGAWTALPAGGGGGAALPSPFVAAAGVAQWRQVMRSFNQTMTPTSGMLVLAPMVVPVSMSVDGLSIETTTTAGSTDLKISMAIYTDLAADYGPASLVASAVVSPNGVAGRLAAIITPVTLTPGIYWYGVLLTGTTMPSIQHAGTASSEWFYSPVGTGTSPSAVTGSTGYVASQSALTALPATAAATHHSDGTGIPFRAVLMWFRVKESA